MITKLKNRVYQFLRKTQKYTGTDNVYLAKGGSWLTLGQVISTVASFLLAVAFANLLDPTTYGNYRYVLSIIGILGILSLPGLNTAITQATARGLEGSFYTAFKTKLKWGLLGSLGAVGLSGYYFLRGNHLLSIPLLISAIFLPLMHASQIYASFLSGRKLFGFGVKYSTLSQVISTAALIITLFLTKNIFWMVAAYLITNTLSNYFFYFLTKIKFQPNRKEDPQTVSYGKHLSLMGVIGETVSQLDKVLLFTLVGAAPLAVYYFALAIPDQIKNISQNFSTLAFPKYSARTPEEIKTGMKQKSLQLFFLASMVILVYVIAIPYVFKIFFPKYLESIFYSQIYIFSLLTLPVGLMKTSFSAKARKKELYLMQIPSFLQIALLVCLVPFFGIMGALGAVLGTKAVGVALTLFLFRKF